MHWALDTNFAMQQGVRRLISGCIELADGRLWIPERAVALAATRYAELARRRAARITEHREGTPQFGLGDATLREIAVKRAIALNRAFHNWALAETTRNDGLWSIAPASDETELISQRLFMDGIARAGTESATEEDAHVAAEAMNAGCRWIASNNLTMLQGTLFTEWLSAEHAQGRLEAAQNPFIVGADEAINNLIAESGIGGDKAQVVTAIAWEIGRPNDPQAAADTALRMDQLKRFGHALEKGGASTAALQVRKTIREGRHDPVELDATLSAYQLKHTLERTRTAEERQVNAERAAIALTTPTGLGLSRPEQVRERR